MINREEEVYLSAPGRATLKAGMRTPTPRSPSQLGQQPGILGNKVQNIRKAKGSRDNMTCIVVCFPAAPGVSQEALQKERELEAHLEKRVAELYDELLEQEEGPSLVGVFRCLATEPNPGLPPGGGLASKRAAIMDAYERLKQSREEQQQQPDPSANADSN